MSVNLLSEQYNQSKEHKLRILRLNNEILEIKSEYLNALKRHYEEYWLNLDLKCYDAKVDCFVSKVKFMTYQASSGKLDDISHKLKKESDLLDQEISKTKTLLEQYKNLNPELLAEYRRLKDDLECQEMLIKISEGNVSL